MLSGNKKFGEKAKRNATNMVPPAVVNSKPPIHTKDDAEAEARRLAECICQRKSTTIHCKWCGAFHFGRLARTCPTHPNVIYYQYDQRSCSACNKQGQLEELPIDRQTYLKLIRIPKS